MKGTEGPRVRPTAISSSGFRGGGGGGRGRRISPKREDETSTRRKKGDEKTQEGRLQVSNGERTRNGSEGRGDVYGGKERWVAEGGSRWGRTDGPSVLHILSMAVPTRHNDIESV